VGRLKDFRKRKQDKLKAKGQELKAFSNRNKGSGAERQNFVSALEQTQPDFGGGLRVIPPPPITAPPVQIGFTEVNIPGVGLIRVPTFEPTQLLPTFEAVRTVPLKPKKVRAPAIAGSALQVLNPDFGGGVVVSKPFAPGTAAARPDLPDLALAPSGPKLSPSIAGLTGSQVFSLAGGGPGGGFGGTSASPVPVPESQQIAFQTGGNGMGLTSSLTGVVGGISDLVTAILPLAEVGVGIAGAVTGSSGGPGITTTGIPPSTLQQSAAAQAGLGGDLQAIIKEFAIGTPASPWKLTCGGRSMGPQMHLQVNPLTQALTWFRPAGKPILWSSDLTAAKRVRKIAARAHRKR